MTYLFEAPVNFEDVQMSSTLVDGDMEEVIMAIERNGVAIKVSQNLR